MDQRELEDHLLARDEQTAEDASQETPANAETVEAPVVDPEPSPVDKYLEKYGGDTQKALEAAVELQSTYGRQGTELGELRKTVEELRGHLIPQGPQEPQYEPVTDQSVTWAQEIGSSENWQDGARWALQNQPALYETIVEARAAYDPLSVSRFETTLALQAQQQQWQQQMAPVIAPMVQQNLQNDFVTAYREVQKDAPDLAEFTPQLLSVAEQNPELLGILQNGSHEAKQRTIRNLYHLAKGQAVAPLQAAAAGAAGSDAAQEAALRVAAAVGTQTGSAPAPSGTPDPLAEWRAAFAEEAGLPTGDAA